MNINVSDSTTLTRIVNAIESLNGKTEERVSLVYLGSSFCDFINKISWGNTENHNTYESIEYTTLSTSNFLFIYYWNTIDGDFHSCYDTINVIKVL